MNSIDLRSKPLDDPQGGETRRRLLESAGEVFAEKGFANATVRDIVGRARVNIAAINYHFGGKEGLYAATLAYWQGVAMAKYPPDMGIRPGDPAEKRLEAFVRSLLYRTLEDGRTGLYFKLVLRELVEPTRVLQDRIDANMRPMLELMRGIVHELAPGLDHVALHRAIASIVAQAVFYPHCRVLVDALFPEQRWTREHLDPLAAQITRFSLGGLGAMAGRKARAAQDSDESR
jgi:AcrR family transcriptional regulator